MKPGTPENFHIKSVTATSIDLSWETPASDGGSKILKYFIERQEDSGEFIPCDSTSGKTTETIIEHLKTEQCYNFRIYASNSVGKCEIPATLQNPVRTTAKMSKYKK